MNKGGNAKSLRPFVCHSLTNKGMEIFFLLLIRTHHDLTEFFEDL